jgi:elongation factor G
MSGQHTEVPRCAVLVGAPTSGKTSLLEALLHTAGALPKQGRVGDGSTLGDHSAEARRRQMTLEPNVAHAEFMGEPWALIDCPGAIELMQDAKTCLMAADVAVVVADPDPAKAVTLAPLLRFLDAHGVPHMLFLNKIDQARSGARELMAALQAVSQRPLVLRQVPIREDERVTGYVDLVSERAYRYREGAASDLIQMPETMRAREAEARQELLESLADLDDALLERLLDDVVPPPAEIYEEISKDLAEDLIVPVLLGAAEHDHGVTRLWKALRHETPGPARAAARLGAPEAAGAGADGLAASVVRTFHLPHTGKLSLTRVWQGELKDGMTVAGQRLNGMVRMQGAQLDKVTRAGAGELVALARVDDLATGDLIGPKGKVADPEILWPAPAQPMHGLAVRPVKRADEVKLTNAIGKLTDEDASLQLAHAEDTGEMELWGQGEIHLGFAQERLASRFNVAIETGRPGTPYRETIRKPTRYHARYKRQSGGHGQFADIHVKIGPQPRGAGFAFHSSIVGGAVPKQYVPAVEAGAREGLQRGPLGFPVVDVAVELVDGQHHSVDSSDQAFRTAGRIALAEGLPQCEPVLLEPIHEVRISVPREFMPRANGLVSGRRGQILGFEEKPGWPGWDELRAYMPAAELTDLVGELRGASQGVAFFEHSFDHMQELSGKLADQVIQQRQSAA